MGSKDVNINGSGGPAGPDMNSNAGDLVACITNAVQACGATPFTEVRIRIGPMGQEHYIRRLRAVTDQRGLCLVLEGDPQPTL